MPGKLFIVGTPIGNLGDISPRAVSVLEQADFIAAEDTRVSLKLLSHLGIKKPLISCHEHNIRERSETVTARILAGESCAFVCDAGMPCISDPGEKLVALCGELGVEAVVIPGPSALTAALALSGIAAGRFSFEGFLSVKKTARASHLEEIKKDPRTLVFYEAPHKLARTLADMLAVFGDRKISLARELTKMHEEIIRTTLSGAVEKYSSEPPRGEFVLVVEGAPPDTNDKIPLEEAVAMVKKLVDAGMPLSSAAKEAAAQTGHKKGELYKAALPQD
ncbi:MAG: 16S rRNA (cytidine(1402)-2'-O)-methyltransferase [Oscillospiraceae bacterium]|nr:16S rRNA (cytidine(1402)-2'-O)-methyltransferase [Oscillospiraceae bacterium]